MARVTRVDRFQRRHSWLGLPIGVLYKFFDDRGPYLAALITYYAFVSLFPLLLLFFSVCRVRAPRQSGGGPGCRGDGAQPAARNRPAVEA